MDATISTMTSRLGRHSKVICVSISMQPSIEQIHIYTHSLVKEMAGLKETIRILNDRNRRMEATVTHISTFVGKQFGISPNPDLEFRRLVSYD